MSTGVDALAVKLGTTVVTRAMSLMLSKSQRDQETRLDMDELIRRHVPGLRPQRSVRRQFEQIADAVAGRVEPMLVHEFRDVSDEERIAVLHAVIGAFTNTDLSDAVVFRSNADPVRLRRLIVDAVPPPAGYTESGTSLYTRMVAECCEYYVQIVRHLPVFTERAVAELLSRVDNIGTDLVRVIEMLPQRSLYAPEDSDHDAAFLLEYLKLVSTSVDEVEMFSFATETPPRTKLSVAYISLGVTAVSSQFADPSSNKRLPVRLRVEEALSERSRVLLRGEAGSGKTTLLRWLAINAARGSFTGDLTAWNGLVPVLVRLRRFSARELPAVGELLDDVAGPITGHLPRNWVDRQLSAGSVLLLVDGVDELLPKDRSRVREWITKLLNSYPRIRVVITSRPAVVGQDWLVEIGFASIFFERMSTEDLETFVRQWHRAVAAAGQQLPCEIEELPEYERALIASLRERKHLHAMASNPLLAAMLCSLHLIRYQKLPRNRMELYQIAVELLIERRDADRHVPSAEDVQLSLADKLGVLRDLAWRLSDNNLSELDITLATGYVADKLETMRHINAHPGDVLDHLLNRSGVLRSPAVGLIDFVHRSFQEYLAAAEIAAQDRIGNLIGRAGQDMWRDVVVMTAGHANMRQRHDLISGILDHANPGSSSERQLRVLAISCLETIESMSPELADRLRRNLVDLVPPQTYDDAVALSSVGDFILRELPRSLAEIPTSTAVSIIQCVTLVGGTEALDLLSRYAEDARWEVRDGLCEAWHKFDSEEYARSVFHRMPPQADLMIVLRHPGQIKAILPLRNLDGVSFTFPVNVADVPVEELRTIVALGLHGLTGVNDLNRLRDLPFPQNIRTLDLFAANHQARIINHDAVEVFTGLSSLRIRGWNTLPSLLEIPMSSRIDSLEIGEIDARSSLEHLGHCGNLRELDLSGREVPPAILSIPRPLPVEKLSLSRCDLSRDLPDVVEIFPEVQELDLNRIALSGHLEDILRLPRLGELRMTDCSEFEGEAVNLFSVTRPRDFVPLNVTVHNTALIGPMGKVIRTGSITILPA